MKKHITTLAISVIAAAALAVSAIYAWFFAGDIFTNVDMNIANIDANISLYRAIDSNYNGTPDKDNEGNFIYSELIADKKAHSDYDTTNITLNINEQDMLPTQIATYKIVIKNNNPQNNKVRFTFEHFLELSDYSNLLKAFSVRIVELDGDTIVHKHNKFYFADFLTNGNITAFDLADNITLNGTFNPNAINIKDFWLQIEFETYENLIKQVADPLALFASQEEYQQIEESTIKLPIFKVYLEI